MSGQGFRLETTDLPEPEQHVAALIETGDLLRTGHGLAVVNRVTLHTEAGTATIDATCLHCLNGGEYEVPAGSWWEIIRKH